MQLVRPPTGPDRHDDAVWADEPVTVPRSLLLAAWAAVAHITGEAT